MLVFTPNRADFVVLIATTREGWATGSGLSRIASAKLKPAEVAPMPIAMEQIATAVKPGSLRSTRKAWPTDGNMGGLRFPGVSALNAPVLDCYSAVGTRVFAISGHRYLRILAHLTA